ncbi:MAG: alpha-amylase [Actinobacteria bacterium]|nr:alpha-amylase [Actinomycetota bacterium]
MSETSVAEVGVDTRPWWYGTFGYQVYLRSFADSNGDGIGDLAGIRGRLDYLVDLCVDFVWITPFYPSPMADWGYDVADYCEVDPRFGTLDDFEALVAAAHRRGLRIIIDLVPNHSSDAHPWFADALTGPDSEHRDYYIWADPGPDGGPPNNWVGYFGGPAWTLDPASGQYYMHLFLPEQPDLNWRNPKVLEEFDRILRFWLDRGVDGFRIDVAGALVKDDLLRSNPQVGPWDPAAGRFEQWLAFEHLHDVFQPESHEVFRRWRAICDEYGAYLLGETYHREPQGLADLVPGDGMHGGFWFEPMHIAWDVDELRRALVGPVELLGERLLWASGSHDHERSPSRFGGGDEGRGRALALNVLFACLPGVPILYQGEELGLVDGRVPPESMLDPVDNGRDGCRTPMPWEPGPGGGFTTGEAWLHSDPRSECETALAQVGDPDSWHSRYTDLLTVRRALPDLFDEPVVWTDGDHGPVISYRRGPVGVAANTSFDRHQVEVPAGSSVVYATPGVEFAGAGQLVLTAHDAVIWAAPS